METEPSPVGMLLNTPSNTEHLETQSLVFDEKQDIVVLFFLVFKCDLLSEAHMFSIPSHVAAVRQETNSLLVERFGLSFTPTKHHFYPL